jgi:hypothetical protein
MTVHDLVRVAYGAPLALLDSQVVGGPPWAKADRFEISAKSLDDQRTSRVARQHICST